MEQLKDVIDYVVIIFLAEEDIKIASNLTNQTLHRLGCNSRKCK